MKRRKGRETTEEVRRARHERRNQARQVRQEERRQQMAVSDPAYKFTNDYGVDTLATCGPQFYCNWHIPAAVADALRKAGRPVPPMAQGAILLDTGATRTCIAQKTADELGLQPTRMQDGFGAGGKHSNPVYLARLEIKIVHPKTGAIHPYAWEQEVEGIPELHNCAAPLVWNRQTMLVTGLLGRDILRHAKVYYDGPAGRLRFEFDLDSLQRQPSR